MVEHPPSQQINREVNMRVLRLIALMALSDTAAAQTPEYRAAFEFGVKECGEHNVVYVRNTGTKRALIRVETAGTSPPVRQRSVRTELTLDAGERERVACDTFVAGNDSVTPAGERIPKGVYRQRYVLSVGPPALDYIRLVAAEVSKGLIMAHGDVPMWRYQTFPAGTRIAVEALFRVSDTVGNTVRYEQIERTRSIMVSVIGILPPGEIQVGHAFILPRRASAAIVARSLEEPPRRDIAALVSVQLPGGRPAALLTSTGGLIVEVDFPRGIAPPRSVRVPNSGFPRPRPPTPNRGRQVDQGAGPPRGSNSSEPPDAGDNQDSCLRRRLGQSPAPFVSHWIVTNGCRYTVRFRAYMLSQNQTYVVYTQPLGRLVDPNPGLPITITLQPGKSQSFYFSPPAMTAGTWTLTTDNVTRVN
jgi:hypothetical protein